MASITLSRDGDVAVMTLSNPPLNLFGPDSFDELSDCVDEIAASDARAAVWRAEGEIFTGGVDVQVFADAVASGRGEDFPSLVGPVKRLEALEMPTLALCHGMCLTAGLEVALGCDGINLINSCEPAAWQTVFHFHMHVIPRYDDDPLQLPGQPRSAEPDELAKVASELRAG